MASYCSYFPKQTQVCHVIERRKCKGHTRRALNEMKKHHVSRGHVPQPQLINSTKKKNHSAPLTPSVWPHKLVCFFFSWAQPWKSRSCSTFHIQIIFSFMLIVSTFVYYPSTCLHAILHVPVYEKEIRDKAVCKRIYRYRAPPLDTNEQQREANHQNQSKM